MDGNIGYDRLCWIVEHITEFEFRTKETQALKQEMRSWYYGARDPGKVDALLRHFDAQYSSNMILGVLGELLWSIGGQMPAGKGPELDAALFGIPHGSVTARSIRSCRADKDWRDGSDFRQLLTQQQEEAKRKVEQAVRGLEKATEMERQWYKEMGMTMPSALACLMIMAFFLCGAVSLLCMSMDALGISGTGGLFDGVDDDMALVIFGSYIVFVVCWGIYLLRNGKRLIMTVRAGFLWSFYQKYRFRERCARLAQIRRGMTQGFDGYCEKLSAAARQLAALPFDAPWKEDHSGELLGQSGLNILFNGIPLQLLPGRGSIEPFCQKLEQCHLPSRMGVAAASVCTTICLQAISFFILWM